MVKIKFGVSNCFAVKRWPEPEEWCKIIKEKFGIKYFQFSFDVLDPSICSGAKESICSRIKDSIEHYGLEISSTFSGLAYYTFNQLLHPDPVVRFNAIQWWENAIETTTLMGAEGTGGPIAAMSVKDFNNKKRKNYLEELLLEYILYIMNVAYTKGLKYFLWEPTPVYRELCSTIQEAKNLYEKINKYSRIHFYYCLDVGHQCFYDSKIREKDPYLWLSELIEMSPILHLQQTDGKYDRHWPFIKEINKKGIISPREIINCIKKSKAKEVLLILEIAHPYEENENKVLSDWVESIDYWKSEHSFD